MALLKAIGDLLDGSGWTSALEQAGIAKAGTADSFLKAVHVKKTARIHQVTACALYRLRQDSFRNWQTSQQETAHASTFEQWCKQQAERSPQFYFWQLVLKVELDVLAWDRSVHEGNFPLYVERL